MEIQSKWPAVNVNGLRIEWHPILQVADPDIKIGISKNSEWLVGNAQGCVEVEPQSNNVRLLPILEQDPVVFMEVLSSALDKLALSKDGLELPAQVAIATGLSGGSEYWAKLALDWLDHIHPSEQILDRLPLVAEARWASQQIRHRAAKLLRQLSRVAQ